MNKAPGERKIYGRRKYEEPKSHYFIGPELFKGRELAHYWLYDCGSAPLNRSGKARTKLSPKNKGLGKHRDDVWVWPTGVKQWYPCNA